MQPMQPKIKMERVYPWFEPTWQRLLNLKQNKKLPHAFLFCGPMGLGKTTLVQAFEQLLLCQTPSMQGACGSCRACYLYQQGSHPDLKHYQEEEAVGIDVIRELSSFLEEASHQKGLKVVTLFDVDKLQTASANALLKTLEEPIGDTAIILVANKRSILPTLKSRCFLINLSMPSTECAITWLKQNAPESNENMLKRSLEFANGAPLGALALLENLTVYETMLQALLSGKASEFDSQEIQQFLISKPLTALYLIYNFLADLLRVALKGEPGYLYNEYQAKSLDQLSNRISLQRLAEYSDKVKEAIRTLALPGINKPLLFEALFCEWQLVCA